MIDDQKTTTTDELLFDQIDESARGVPVITFTTTASLANETRFCLGASVHPGGEQIDLYITRDETRLVTLVDPQTIADLVDSLIVHGECWFHIVGEGEAFPTGDATIGTGALDQQDRPLLQTDRFEMVQNDITLFRLIRTVLRLTQ